MNGVSAARINLSPSQRYENAPTSFKLLTKLLVYVNIIIEGKYAITMINEAASVDKVLMRISAKAWVSAGSLRSASYESAPFSLDVASILLEEGKEPAHRLLIIIVC